MRMSAAGSARSLADSIRRSQLEGSTHAYTLSPILDIARSSTENEKPSSAAAPPPRAQLVNKIFYKHDLSHTL